MRSRPGIVDCPLIVFLHAASASTKVKIDIFGQIDPGLLVLVVLADFESTGNGALANLVTPIRVASCDSTNFHQSTNTGLEAQHFLCVRRLHHRLVVNIDQLSKRHALLFDIGLPRYHVQTPLKKDRKASGIHTEDGETFEQDRRNARKEDG